MKKKKIILLTIAFILLATIACLFFFIFLPKYQDKKARENDVTVASTQSFQQLLVSNTPAELLDAYPLEYFRGYATYKTAYTFKDGFDLADYLNTVLEMNQDIIEVYLFPLTEYEDSTYINVIQQVVEKYYYVTFRFMLPGYSMEYLCALESTIAEAYYDSLIAFYDGLKEYPNTVFYYFGNIDWVISNPDCYIDGKMYAEDVNTHLMTLTLASDEYMVGGEGLEPLLKAVDKRVTKEKIQPTETYDLSNAAIVFMGDSIIGNFEGALSIPGFVGGLSNSNTYNFGIGGTSASSESAGAKGGFEEVLSYLIEGEGTIEHENANAEIERFKKKYRKKQDLCFVIGYGLNDYFLGRPLLNPSDDMDVTTYRGALKAGIERLNAAYPNAKFVLFTPPYVLSFEYGTLVQSENGSTLDAYVDTAEALAHDLGIPCVNNYKDLGVDYDNVLSYLLDDCHYNEKGRILMARHMLPYLYELLGNEEK